jgi:ElaB/YqjD/DUF883 family membrane-anchored ribosome-binding protein
MSDEEKTDQPEQTVEAAVEADKNDKGAGECPEVRLAAEAVRLAKIELEKAHKFYDDVRRRAEDKIKAVRETTVGDIIDKTLVAVKRHPGPSLFVSAAAGFFLGRWFQRIFKGK